MKVRGIRREATRGFVLHLLVLSAFIGIFLLPFPAEGADTASLIVKLTDNLTIEEQAEVITRDGGEQSSYVQGLRLHIIKVPTADLPVVLQNYSSDPQVVSVEVGKTRRAEGTPSDAQYGVQWALGKIGWDQLFGTMTPAGSAKIALLDTGVEGGHPDLSGSVVPGTSMLENGSNGLTDANGHGTALAGIVAAVTNNDAGIAGVAYQGVSIMPVNVLDASGVGEDGDIIAGIVWAADQGADVILMGFSNADFSQSLQDAIDYAWSKGAVLVAATGNGGVSTPTFPAGDRGVIGVSATDESDLLAAGSNYGPSTFLAAPGANIFTTSIGGTYAYMSGTSASSAFVAAIAGFMKASDPTLTNGVIVGRLARTADAAGAADDPGNQEKFGNGRVNMARAVADSSLDAVQPDGAAPVGNGGPYIGPYLAASQAFDMTIGEQQGTLTYGTGGSATFDVTLTAKNDNGQGNISTTLSVSGLPAGVTALPITVSSSKTIVTTLTLSGTPLAPAGAYNFTVTATAQPNDLTTTGTLTIAPPNLVITAHDKLKSYGDTLTLGSGDFTATGLVDGETVESVTLTASGGAEPTAAVGTYSISPSEAVGTFTPSNYSISYLPGTLTVQPAPLTIRAADQEKNYGEEVAFGAGSELFTSSGLRNGETIGSVTLYCAGGSAAAGPGIYSLVPSQATGGSFNPENYTISYESGALTVGRMAVTVTLNNLAQVYSGASLTPTAVTAPAGLNIVWTNAPQTEAGQYTVTATVDDPNYTGSASGTFTITPASQSITFNRPADRQYGAAPFFLNAGATSSLPVSFQSKTPLVCTVSGNEAAIVGLGTCTIEAAQPGNTNYYAALPIEQSFTVTAGELDHFELTVPEGPKTAGTPFVITITARDAADNVVTGFSGAANLGTTAGTIVPSLTGEFVGGSWNGEVSVTRAGTGKTVTATETATGKAGSSGSFDVLPGEAIAFSITAPASAVAGQPLTLTVTAKDQHENVASGYTGTVRFTTASAGASLPEAFTFQPDDNGSHTFTEGATFYAAGNRTVTVTDSVSGISSFSNDIEVSAAGAERLLVQAASSAAAGSPFDVTVSVTDAYNNTVTGYAGTVRFTSNAPGSSAVLPVDYTFTSQDEGSHTFSGLTSLTTAGTWTVSAEDSSTAISGTSGSIWISAGSAVHLAVETAADGSGRPVGAQSITAGSSVTGYAVARDSYGNYVANVAADWSLPTPADGVVPEDLEPAQDGKSANFTGKRVGTATILAASQGLVGSQSGLITVTPAPLHHFALSPIQSSVTVGAGVPLSVTAEDSFGNLVGAFTGSVALSISDGSSVSPATTGSFHNGSWSGMVTITGAGTARVVTAKTTGGSETGSSNTFNVEKIRQTIVLGVVAAKTYGEAPFDVTAQGGASGNPVTITASPSSVCGISGRTVTITGTGSCLLTASQEGDDSYQPAPQVQQSFTVNKGNQIITFTSVPGKTTADPPFGLTATSTSGQAVLFQLISGPATISGNMVTITGTGTILVRAYRPADANYNAAQVDQSIVVSNAVVKCTAPGRLTVPSSSYGSTYIYWGASSTANVTYVLEGKPAAGGSWAGVYSGIKNYTTILVSAEGNYVFRVKAVRSDLLDSDYSTSATICRVTLGPPQNLVVPATSYGPIYIYWKASATTGASYLLEQSRDGGAWVPVYTGTKPYTNIAVGSKGNYSFRVKANCTGFTDSSYALSTSCSVTMGPPRNLVVPAASNGPTYIYWGASATAGATYFLEKSTDGTNWSTAYTGTSNYTTVNITAQGNYSFRVMAYHPEFGYSAGYATATPCSVTLGAPSNLVVPASSTGSIHIYWKASATTGASYVLERSSDGNNWLPVYTGTSNYVYLNVDTSGSYYFRVKATHPDFSDDSGYVTSTSVCNVTVPNTNAAYIDLTSSTGIGRS